MKTNRLLGLVLTTFAAAALHQAAAQPVTLTGNSYTNTFDDLEGAGGAFETGWYLFTGANATTIGSAATWSATSWQSYGNYWTNTSGRFANQASSVDYSTGSFFTGSETRSTQSNAVNRCLAIRQTGSLGDPGAAFVLKLAETANRQNFHLLVDFMNLDRFLAGRATTWTVDYGIGSAPSSFVPVASWVNSSSNVFGTYRTNITFPNGTIDNIADQVWIRIVALTASTGSGSRPMTGIDNFGLTWDTGAACVPASITADPTPVNGYLNGTANFSVGAMGSAPVSYVWVKNGTTVLNDDGHFVNTTTPMLTINSLQPSDAGTYSCIVSNACNGVITSRTSKGAALTVNNPTAVSIAYLHTLVNPDTFMPTNSSAIYQVTGMITTATNMTSGNTASYYLQDGTGGINLFCSFGSSFRPALGDTVTAVGYLNGYQGNLEIEADLNNPAYSVNVVGNDLANYPKAKALAWDNLWQGGTNAALNYGPLGSIVILPNVYFGTNAGILTSNVNLNCTVTNASGQVARVYFPCQQNNELTNRTIPAFAAAVQGPLVAGASGYSIDVTRWADMMTSPLSINVTRVGTASTITWTAVPVTYSYTVLGATDAKGPYSVLATGLKFTDTNGLYKDTTSSGSKFYRVTSP